MTAVGALQDVAARMDFGRFAIPIRIEVHSHGASICIAVKLQVEDSDGSGPTEVTHRELVVPAFVESFAGRLEEFVYSRVENAVRHELAEHYRFDGRMVRDPHRGNR